MSKFKDNIISGGNNQFGGNNNTQTNITNTYNRNHINDSDNMKNSEIPVGIVIFIGFGMMIWWFFKNIDLIYHYLSVFTISSVGLSALSIIILTLCGETTNRDFLRFTGSTLFAAGLFILSIFSLDHAPNDIIWLSEQVNTVDFGAI